MVYIFDKMFNRHVRKKCCLKFRCNISFQVVHVPSAPGGNLTCFTLSTSLDQECGVLGHILASGKNLYLQTLFPYPWRFESIHITSICFSRAMYPANIRNVVVLLMWPFLPDILRNIPPPVKLDSLDFLPVITCLGPCQCYSFLAFLRHFLCFKMFRCDSLTSLIWLFRGNIVEGILLQMLLF
jgi:hypothetical protein